jgi:hypothetical protein
MTQEIGMISASRGLVEVGVLPVSGGLLDQSVTWWKALAILAAEFNATRARMSERKE